MEAGNAGAPAAGEVIPPAAGAQKGAEPVVPGAEAGKDAAAQAAQVQKFKFKFEVDGQETEEEYDEKTLQSALQKAKGADKRFQEANETQKKVARMVEMMKTPAGLKKLLAHPNLYGDKARSVMEQLLWEDIQREQMDPKERENMELKEQLRAREDSEKERLAEVQRQEFEKLKNDHATRIDKEIVEAIKTAGQQVTPYFFKRVAHYMLSAVQQGKQVAPKDVVPLVVEDLQNDIRSMFETTTEDQILQLLKSDKAWENIRKADLKRFKNPPSIPPAVPHKQDEKKKPGDNDLMKRTSIFDWE